MILEFTKKSGLADQQPVGILLSPFPSAGITGMCTWVLGLKHRSLFL